MWLCEYESEKTVIIEEWKLIYTNHQRQYHNTIFQAYCQDVWKKTILLQLAQVYL